MTKSEVIASCWGDPRKVVEKTTAAGVEESFQYPGGKVTLVDGRVVEIIEARETPSDDEVLRRFKRNPPKLISPELDAVPSPRT